MIQICIHVYKQTLWNKRRFPIYLENRRFQNNENYNLFNYKCKITLNIIKQNNKVCQIICYNDTYYCKSILLLFSCSDMALCFFFWCNLLARRIIFHKELIRKLSLISVLDNKSLSISSRCLWQYYLIVWWRSLNFKQ